jgi:redox-sensitive bicupin YhaK (pirin superfamily)
MLERIVDARPRDVAGFKVGRVLPMHGRTLVGPFIFFDHMGPNTLAAGQGMDVPPHPHIGLETVTYLFAGEVHHKDSTGASQTILPGDINWMTAGRGVVHSERSNPDARARGGEVHGLQLWVALPKEHEETAPSFAHHPTSSLPTITDAKKTLRILAGSAYGKTSPVHTFSPLFYVDASLSAGEEIEVPSHEERAVYVVEGSVSCGETTLHARQMGIFAKGSAPTLRPNADSRLVLLGGDSLPEKRFIWWNFVSSSEARLEEAKRQWAEQRFPKVPGDEIEFVPLPGVAK